MVRFQFDNSYARLPEGFFSKAEPASVEAVQLLLFNEALADQLGIERDGATEEALAQVFSGQRWLRAPNPWPRLMPAISLASLCRNWAMAGPFCWVRWSTRKGSASMCN